MKFPRGGYNSCELIKVHPPPSLAHPPTHPPSQPFTHLLTHPRNFSFFNCDPAAAGAGDLSQLPFVHTRHVKFGRILVSRRGMLGRWGQFLSLAFVHAYGLKPWRLRREVEHHDLIDNTRSLLYAPLVAVPNTCYTTPKEGHVHGPPHRVTLKNWSDQWSSSPAHRMSIVPVALRIPTLVSIFSFFRALAAGNGLYWHHWV